MKNENFWCIIPKQVRKSTVLNDSEKELWYEIAENLNNAGFCKLTNTELATLFHTRPDVISRKLSSMAKKGYLGITQETRNHARRLYPKYPGEIEIEKPTNETCQIKIEKIKEAIKNGIKLTQLEFQALVEKMRFSPVLDEIKDGTVQFALTIEQIHFLSEFNRLYPNKELDVQLSSVVKPIDYKRLLIEIESSEFLKNSNNLSLKWTLENYEDIIGGNYRNFNNSKQQSFTGRTYTREELDSCIQNVDEVVID